MTEGMRSAVCNVPICRANWRFDRGRPKGRCCNPIRTVIRGDAETLKLRSRGQGRQLWRPLSFRKSPVGPTRTPWEIAFTTAVWGKAGPLCSERALRV